jgi:hypothetical protein
MTFGQQVVATFVGSTSGFVFGVALFILTERVRRRWQKGTVAKYVIREIKYDLSLLSTWAKQVAKILGQVAAEDKRVWEVLGYGKFQRTFIQQAFVSGVLYDRLSDEEIRGLEEVVSHFDLGLMNYFQSLISEWQNGEVAKLKMHQSFQFECDEIQRFTECLEGVIGRLEATRHS